MLQKTPQEWKGLFYNFFKILGIICLFHWTTQATPGKIVQSSPFAPAPDGVELPKRALASPGLTTRWLAMGHFPGTPQCKHPKSVQETNSPSVSQKKATVRRQTNWFIPSKPPFVTRKGSEQNKVWQPPTDHEQRFPKNKKHAETAESHPFLLLHNFVPLRFSNRWPPKGELDVEAAPPQKMLPERSEGIVCSLQSAKKKKRRFKSKDFRTKSTFHFQLGVLKHRMVDRNCQFVHMNVGIC